MKNTTSLLVKYTLIGFCMLFSIMNLWAQSTDVTLCNYSPTANTINISGITQNLSGVTYNEETNTLFMVANGPLAVYETELNGDLLRTIPLSGSNFDDTEGIVHIEGNRFAVSDEEYKRVIFFDIPSTGTNITSISYVQLPLSFGPWGNKSNKSLEGVSYNPATNMIYVVKEGGLDKDDITYIPKGFYAFELPSSLPHTLSVAEVEQLCDIDNHPSDFGDLAGLHHLGRSFPGNNDYLLLSEVDTTLVHISENCNELGRLSLANMDQPEGVAMDNNGNIYVVGEPNQLLVISPNQSPEITNIQITTDCGNGNIGYRLTLDNLDAAYQYDIFYTTDLTSNTWLPAAPSGINISGSTGVWIDCGDNDRDTEDNLFYRIEGSCDSDNDGLSDAYEILSISTNPSEIDSDADGIPDSIEDSDCDGFTNIDEYTNPFMGATSNCDNNCRYTDSLTLVDFYTSTNGSNWTTKWDLTLPMNTWHGVILNADGCVESIIIGLNKISGTLPASIGDLSELKILALGGNEIGASIPPTIGQLSKLTNLGLGGNNFTGGIPPQIGDLANLEQLWLAGNLNLGGNIPPELGQLAKLTHLIADNCKLSGNLPAALTGMAKIRYWTLFNNDLSGCYPPELSVLHSRLHPAFSTNEKVSVGNDFGITWEVFCNDPTTTCVPNPPCTQRDSLILVDFYNSTNGPNWIIKWNLTQPMNTWHGVNTNTEGCVESIIIGLNNISGTLPTSIGDLSELKILALGGNEISGTIPASIGQLNQLTNLGLGGNNFTGGIPPQIGDLANLEQLWLAGNLNLGGNIPPELGQLGKLTHLIADNCKLTGNLPAALTGMAKIRYWKLFNNDLSGCYPPELLVLHSRLHPDFSTNEKVSAGNDFSASWEDFWSSQSGVCQAGTKIEDTYISGYNIYPNPTQNGTTLNLEFDSQTDNHNATLSIYNITGQLVKSEDLTIQNGQNQFSTTLENYATGIYLVKLQSGTYTGTQKLVIQK